MLWLQSRRRFPLLLTLLVLQIVPGCAFFQPQYRTAQHATRPLSPTDSRPADAFQAEMAEASARPVGEPTKDSDAILTGLPGEVDPAPLTESNVANSWGIGLLEVIHLALTNNDVIPVDAQFLSSSSPLLNTPELVASVYDPAIQATGVAGNRGTIAASSDFVPVFSARSTWGEDDVIQNNLVSAGLPAGSVLETDTGQLQLSLQQQLGTGGTLEFQHNTTFDENNVATNLFPNVYRGQLALEYNQPLWSGAGDLFTAIAGPINLISTRAPSVDQGILITRLNEKLSENEFQVALRQLIKDVTDVYQNLNLAHQRHQVESTTRDAIREIWERVKAQDESGDGRGLASVAQAEESLHAANARVRDALAEISLTENRLRRLTGVGPQDGRVLRPSETAQDNIYAEDWDVSLDAAFSTRPELHETSLTIRSLELQRTAAKSLTRPRLDLVTNFHVNGFGDRPFNDSGRPTVRPDSYYQNLLKAGHTGWFAGVEFSVPLDQRQTRALQHQLEHRLAKARAALQAQKKEIAHELWHAFRSAERWSDQVAENQRRVDAARDQVESLEATWENGDVTVDLLIRAHTTMSTAGTELARVTTEYHKAMNEVRFRRGTLLEDLNVTIKEAIPGLTVPAGAGDEHDVPFPGEEDGHDNSPDNDPSDDFAFRDTEEQQRLVMR